MANVIWSDISEFQVPVTDQYPYNFLCIRSNDGNHIDKKIQQNLSWCKSRRASGKLFGFMVYYFYRPGVNGATNLMSQVGAPDPRMTVMIDVEGAGGQVSGNQSGAINAQFNQLAGWLKDARRVVGYGNVSDLNSLWPQKPGGIRLVVAAYGSNPSYPGKFAHQYADNANTPPFGPSDINSADNMSQQDLEKMFGFSGSPPPTPPTPPAPPATKAPVFPYPASDYLGLPSSDPHCHSGHYGGVDATNVKTWQTQMKARGWSITPDGDFGQKSNTVCRQFQAEKHLGVDGKVGPQTWSTSWSASVT
jgi:Putative peptidoglycan binding domain